MKLRSGTVISNKAGKDLPAKVEEVLHDNLEELKVYSIKNPEAINKLIKTICFATSRELCCINKNR
jgi:hypothetical protein